MTHITTQNAFRLPTLKEIVDDTEESIKENQLMVLLNQAPPIVTGKQIGRAHV